MSDPNTGEPVPLWYEVTVEFSDGFPTATEAWTEKGLAESAVKEWKRIESEQNGWTITTLTVAPRYTPFSYPNE